MLAKSGKMNPKLIIGGVVVALIAGLSYTSYRIGVEKTVAKYNLEVARITEEALNEQAKLQESINEITDAYYTSTYKDQKKIDQLQLRLSTQPVIKECVKDASGNTVAHVSDDVVSVFDEARSDKTLPLHPDSERAIQKTNPVTVNKLAEYGLVTIKEYNACAKQVNSLIDVLNSLKP